MCLDSTVSVSVDGLGLGNPRLRSLGLILQHTVHIIDTLAQDKQSNRRPFQPHDISNLSNFTHHSLFAGRAFRNSHRLTPNPLSKPQPHNPHSNKPQLQDSRYTVNTPQQCTSSTPSSSPL